MVTAGAIFEVIFSVSFHSQDNDFDLDSVSKQLLTHSIRDQLPFDFLILLKYTVISFFSITTEM